ncbi:MAG: ATP-binding protein, partial [Fimbriimonadaceae bacterium]
VMDSGSWVLQVMDTGIGISNDEIGLIFDEFTQVDATSTRRHGGTGLGLTITKGLVELMGGRIDVESELTVGTTFIVTLPLKPVAEEEAA